MFDYRSEFEELLHDRLVPDFCSEAVRSFDPSAFQRASLKIGEQDARYFIRAFNAGLIEHQGCGRYRAPASATFEQFFWEGFKRIEPRRLTLWLEPIITVAGLARLHFDYGWPEVLIGTQSKDGAFDLISFLPDSPNEFIAGEVKKTANEIILLLDHMRYFGGNPAVGAPLASGPERNAYKKVLALRSRRAPVFWALGPDGYSQVFDLTYGDQGQVELIPTESTALAFDTGGTTPRRISDFAKT